MPLGTREIEYSESERPYGVVVGVGVPHSPVTEPSALTTKETTSPSLQEVGAVNCDVVEGSGLHSSPLVVMTTYSPSAQVSTGLNGPRSCAMDRPPRTKRERIKTRIPSL